MTLTYIHASGTLALSSRIMSRTLKMDTVNSVNKLEYELRNQVKLMKSIKIVGNMTWLAIKFFNAKTDEQQTTQVDFLKQYNSKMIKYFSLLTTNCLQMLCTFFFYSLGAQPRDY